MAPTTLDMWQKQNRHEGDRERLFSAVRNHVGGTSALYPGSYVDIAASVVFPTVTYVDLDRRAAKFFSDTAGVLEIIEDEGGSSTASVSFIHADYTEDLDLDVESFDVLISLYAGFVSESCTQHLRIGGALLVNPSHGDAAMASIDARYALSGVVLSDSGTYHITTEALDTYLVPKAEITITAALLHERGRGIAYTKSPFAYLFTRIV
ncbi:MAG: hypothetical protein ACR2NG_00845 [Acidimicrobiia bacterium]